MYTCNAYVYIASTYVRISARRSYCIHDVERETREKERKKNKQKEREKERERGVRRSSIDWLETWWNVAAILGVY